MSKYGLINKDSSYSGTYRVKVFEIAGKIRVYIPGISQINPFDANGHLMGDVVSKNMSAFPVAQWCAYNLESCELENISEPMWCMFEGGDVKKPVIISYTFPKVVIQTSNSSDGSGGSGGGSNSSTGSFTTASGPGVINIQGPINDSRNTKYSDISQVPQVISQEWSINGCLSKINEYASQSAGSNSIAPVAKAINAAGGASSVYNSALGTNVVSIGNAVLCATTSKFGVDGDYLLAHFTDNTEVLFVRFDQKSTSAVYGPADPANEWGHWADWERGFSNATTISILEICGMSRSGINKTCDYIINLGVNIKNDASFAKKSISEIKSSMK